MFSAIQMVADFFRSRSGPHVRRSGLPNHYKQPCWRCRRRAALSSDSVVGGRCVEELAGKVIDRRFNRQS
jgi:hypothetical protein